MALLIRLVAVVLHCILKLHLSPRVQFKAKVATKTRRDQRLDRLRRGYIGSDLWEIYVLAHRSTVLTLFRYRYTKEEKIERKKGGCEWCCRDMFPWLHCNNLQRKALFLLGPVGGHLLVNRVRLIEIIIELVMLKRFSFEVKNVKFDLCHVVHLSIISNCTLNKRGCTFSWAGWHACSCRPQVYTVMSNQSLTELRYSALLLINKCKSADRLSISVILSRFAN